MHGTIVRRRLWFIVTAVAVLLGVLTAAPATGDDLPGRPLGEIALVPLDDRPFTFYEPQVVGRAAGFDVAAPSEDLLGEFLEPGDADAVAAWWREEAAQVDRSVVAIPMLAYGGLVASRTCAVSESEALERLEVLDEVRAAGPGRRIFAFDVITRLAPTPTGSYPGTYAGAVRNWAILLDEVNNLGMEDKREDLEAVAAGIPEEIKDDYLCTRARNHAINKEMIRKVADGTLDFLILGQDDAEEHGLHRPERLALQDLAADLGVTDRVRIYPGADVLGPLLVAKHVTETLDSHLTVHPTWSRTPGDEWVAPYQDVPYGELVGSYVETLGGSVVDDPADADVLLMANTAGGGDLTRFADSISEAVARGRAVAVGDDAAAGTADTELFELLTDRIQLADLASYSGWNVGLSIAHAMAREAMLAATAQRDGPTLSPSTLVAAAQAHIELIAQEYGHTHCYRNGPRTDVRDLAVELDDDPQNMTTAFPAAQDLAREDTQPCLDALADEFAGARVPAGFVNPRRAFVPTITDLGPWDVNLAWNRYQEIEAIPDVAASRAASDHQYAVGATVVPYAQDIHPRFASTVDGTLVLRNTHHRSAEVVVRIRPPEGAEQPDDITLSIPAMAVREVPVSFTMPPAGAEGVLPWHVDVVHTAPGVAGEVTTTASAVLNAQNPNLVAAASGGTATASGFTPPYEPSRAIDGNRESIGSRWLTGAADEHWIRIDLEEPALMDTVRLWQYPNYELRDYSISGLVDGTWTALATVTDNTDTVTEYEFDPVEVSAIRLDITRTRDARARLYEIEAECARSATCAQGE